MESKSQPITQRITSQPVTQYVNRPSSNNSNNNNRAIIIIFASIILILLTCVILLLFGKNDSSDVKDTEKIEATSNSQSSLEEQSTKEAAEAAARAEEAARAQEAARAAEQAAIAAEQARTEKAAKALERKTYGNCTLVGKLNGKHSLTIHLTNGFNGYLKYKKGHANIPAYGECNNGYLVIKEWTDGVGLTGIFSGTFDGNNYRGTYVRERDGKNFSFNFTAR